MSRDGFCKAFIGFESEGVFVLVRDPLINSLLCVTLIV